jgi:zinc finger FYVE domain-containing protein 1
MSSLSCAEFQACDAKVSSKATFYCVQCNSLQCILCEKQIHGNLDNQQHERLNLDQIDDEYCSIDKQHQGVFYCPTCAASFCYACYVNQHQHSDGREHKPQKYKGGQLLTTEKNK